MRLVDAAKPTFARHETFHPRYGWFRKAYSHVSADCPPVRRLNWRTYPSRCS